MQKAKNWADLDTKSKDQILKCKVEFQGNTFPLGNLQLLMIQKFDLFISKHINQNVIHQVINDEILKLKVNLDEGFITVCKKCFCILLKIKMMIKLVKSQ